MSTDIAVPFRKNLLKVFGGSVLGYGNGVDRELKYFDDDDYIHPVKIHFGDRESVTIDLNAVRYTSHLHNDLYDITKIPRTAQILTISLPGNDETETIQLESIFQNKHHEETIMKKYIEWEKLNKTMDDNDKDNQFASFRDDVDYMTRILDGKNPPLHDAIYTPNAQIYLYNKEDDDFLAPIFDPQTKGSQSGIDVILVPPERHIAVKRIVDVQIEIRQQQQQQQQQQDKQQCKQQRDDNDNDNNKFSVIDVNDLCTFDAVNRGVAERMYFKIGKRRIKMDLETDQLYQLRARYVLKSKYKGFIYSGWNDFTVHIRYCSRSSSSSKKQRPKKTALKSSNSLFLQQHRTEMPRQSIIDTATKTCHVNSDTETTDDSSEYENDDDSDVSANMSLSSSSSSKKQSTKKRTNKRKNSFSLQFLHTKMARHSLDDTTSKTCQEEHADNETDDSSEYKDDDDSDASGCTMPLSTTGKDKKALPSSLDDLKRPHSSPIISENDSETTKKSNYKDKKELEKKNSYTKSLPTKQKDRYLQSSLDVFTVRRSSPVIDKGDFNTETNDSEYENDCGGVGASDHDDEHRTSTCINSSGKSKPAFVSPSSLTQSVATTTNTTTSPVLPQAQASTATKIKVEPSSKGISCSSTRSHDRSRQLEVIEIDDDDSNIDEANIDKRKCNANSSPQIIEIIDSESETEEVKDTRDRDRRSQTCHIQKLKIEENVLPPRVMSMSSVPTSSSTMRPLLIDIADSDSEEVKVLDTRERENKQRHLQYPNDNHDNVSPLTVMSIPTSISIAAGILKQEEDQDECNEEIHNFLTKICGADMTKYKKIFLDNGYDTMAALKLIDISTMDELKQIGIHRRGHRNVLKAALLKIQNRENDVRKEDTSYNSNVDDDSKPKTEFAATGKPFKDPALATEQFKDPVLAADGYVYERDYIDKWMETKSYSPHTGREFTNKILCPVSISKLKKSISLNQKNGKNE